MCLGVGCIVLSIQPSSPLSPICLSFTSINYQEADLGQMGRRQVMRTRPLLTPADNVCPLSHVQMAMESICFLTPTFSSLRIDPSHFTFTLRSNYWALARSN